MKKVILLAVVLVSIFTLSCTKEEVSPVGDNVIFGLVESADPVGKGDDIDQELIIFTIIVIKYIQYI